MILVTITTLTDHSSPPLAESTGSSVVAEAESLLDGVPLKTVLWLYSRGSWNSKLATVHTPSDIESLTIISLLQEKNWVRWFLRSWKAVLTPFYWRRQLPRLIWLLRCSPRSKQKVINQSAVLGVHYPLKIRFSLGYKSVQHVTAYVQRSSTSFHTLWVTDRDAREWSGA